MKQFSDGKVTIRIRVKRASVESMRSQPLHTSQQEVEATDKYADLSIVQLSLRSYTPSYCHMVAAWRY